MQNLDRRLLQPSKFTNVSTGNFSLLVQPLSLRFSKSIFQAKANVFAKEAAPVRQKARDSTAKRRSLLDAGSYVVLRLPDTG